MRATKAVINLSNLVYNFNCIKKKINSKKIIAVVKADAYGHGSLQVSKKLLSLKNPPEYLAVAFLEEAVLLRKNKINSPILLFEPLSNENLKDVLKWKLIPTITSESQIYLLKNLKNKISVHVKVDTGMGRLGVKYYKAVQLFERLDKLKNVIIDGTYTHFASTDEESSEFTALQKERFDSVLQQLKSKGINTGLVHAANSGAIWKYNRTYYDAVRPGISLYGYFPFDKNEFNGLKLKPVMSIESDISSIEEFSVGETVSYGRQFTIMNENQYIASIPIGYADGLNRNLTNNIQVLCNGSYYSQVGRVTMDRIMINCGTNPLRVGNKVVLLGKSNKKIINAWDWSRILNTIPYEITCGISKRVPRVYINE